MLRNSTDKNVYQLIHQSVPDVGAGAPNYQFGPPTRAHLTLALFSAKYTSDANAANRLISVNRWTAGTRFPLASIAYPILANETWTIIGSLNPLPNTATSQGVLYLPLPDIPFFIHPEWVSFLFDNAQAGDAFTDLEMYYKLWVYET